MLAVRAIKRRLEFAIEGFNDGETRASKTPGVCIDEGREREGEGEEKGKGKEREKSSTSTLNHFLRQLIAASLDPKFACSELRNHLSWPSNELGFKSSLMSHFCLFQLVFLL